MNLEWDESKRLWVAEQRGIDFVAVAVALFDGRPVLTWSSDREPEERYATLGEIEGKFFVAIWTWRDDAARLITARRARDGEEKRYHAAFG